MAMVEMLDAELEEIYQYAVQLGKDAGKILINAIERRREGPGVNGEEEQLTEKLNAVDIVTQTDNGKLPVLEGHTSICLVRSQHQDQEFSHHYPLSH